MPRLHQRHRRPLRDYALASLEQLLPLMAQLPALSNLMLGTLGAPVLRLLGLVHLPLLAKATRSTPARRETGCRGMAATWGHLRENQILSAKIFAQSWGPLLHPTPDETEMPILATGFSCRCQAKLRANRRLPHPIQMLHHQICTYKAIKP